MACGASYLLRFVGKRTKDSSWWGLCALLTGEGLAGGHADKYPGFIFGGVLHWSLKLSTYRRMN